MTGTILLLVAALVWAYQSVWSAGWVYEDTALHFTVALWPGGWRHRALTMWTWALTPTPQAAHLCNLGLHGATACLTALLAHRLGLSRVAVWAVAAFVLLNPVAVESVAYAAGRGELLAALAVVGACVLAAGTSRWRMPLAWLALGAGFAAKESAVVGLALVPLTLWVTGQAWRVAAGVGVGMGLVGVWWYGPVTLVNLELYAYQVTAVDWLLVQSAAAVRLVGVTLTGMGMTPDYDYDLVPLAWRGLSLWLLLALAALAWSVRHTYRICAFALAWTLLSVLPRLIVQTPRSYLNEHQFYVPALGLLLLVACGIHALVASPLAEVSRV